MSDMLHDGAAWFAEQINQHASRTVIYRRGTEKVATNPKGSFATQRRDAENQNQSGFFLHSSYQAILIQRSSIVLRGKVVLPEEGDQIEDPANGKIYEVTCPDNEPCFRYADPAHLMLRIHTMEK